MDGHGTLTNFDLLFPLMCFVYLFLAVLYTTVISVIKVYWWDILLIVKIQCIAFLILLCFLSVSFRFL